MNISLNIRNEKSLKLDCRPYSLDDGWLLMQVHRQDEEVPIFFLDSLCLVDVIVSILKLHNRDTAWYQRLHNLSCNSIWNYT